MYSAEPVLPSSTSETIDSIVARWSSVGRSGLLPALIEAEERFGWLSQETLAGVAQGLNVPLSEAFGVADFYANLHTRPVGRKIVRVCDDVPCYLGGSERICAAVEKRLNVREGETTADGAFTYEIVPCLGQCDHAAVVMIGDQLHESVTPETVVALLEAEQK